MSDAASDSHYFADIPGRYPVGRGDRDIGAHSSVSGGVANTAHGFRSSVGGDDDVFCTADTCGEGSMTKPD